MTTEATTEKAERFAENALVKLSARVGMIIASPLLVALLIWSFSTVQTFDATAARMEARIHYLETTATEERRANVADRVRDTDVATKLATLDERVRGLSENVSRFLTLLERRTELFDKDGTERLPPQLRALR